MTSIQQSVMVHPAASMGGSLVVPGDKSVSHRMAMLAGIASGTSTVHNFLHSEDTLCTLRAMEALGARTFVGEDGTLHIQGNGGNLLEPAGSLDCGNSGTTIRLLAGVMAGNKVHVEMSGDDSLRLRPMGRIKEPLERMGAKVELTGEKGTAPIRITGGNLKGIDYLLPIASAQVKSCILLASLWASGETTITEPVPTRDHTELLFRRLKLPITVDRLTIRVKGFGVDGPQIKADEFLVPGDFSSAAFWLMAVAARPKATVTIKNVGLNPRRTALLDVLKRAGVHVNLAPRGGKGDGEPIGDIHVTGGPLKAVTVGGVEIPNLIDELPLVAVLGALAHGTTVIQNAGELRVKESDRIATMAGNLRTLGVEVEERDDGMAIKGPTKSLKPAGALRSFGDHRIAMAMSILATYCEEKVLINNTACVDTSYPGFWKDLQTMGGHVE
jgi:3-phosphoshikimate 1-carboxyvinyltransferase